MCFIFLFFNPVLLKETQAAAFKEHNSMTVKMVKSRILRIIQAHTSKQDLSHWSYKENEGENEK